MKVTKATLAGILLLEPATYADNRGFFVETYERAKYEALGIKEKFVQDNHSRSARGVLRGLHFTREKPQAQIVTVLRGRIFDVVVDIRKASPTFGQWFGTELADDQIRQIYMSHGFAHGFCVLSEVADLHYKVSQTYDPKDDGGLRWNDPEVGIKWPVDMPVMSERDRNHPLLRAIQLNPGKT